MSLEISDIENIAHLARLQLSKEEMQEAAGSISNILKLIDQMQAVSTENMTPLAHAFEASQRLRDDVVTESNQRDELQLIAPQCEAGLYLVPRVIE